MHQTKIVRIKLSAIKTACINTFEIREEFFYADGKKYHSIYYQVEKNIKKAVGIRKETWEEAPGHKFRVTDFYINGNWYNYILEPSVKTN